MFTTVDKDYLALNECGGLVDWHNNYQIVEVVVVCKIEEVGDTQIDNLIKKLPTYIQKTIILLGHTPPFCKCFACDSPRITTKRKRL